MTKTKLSLEVYVWQEQAVPIPVAHESAVDIHPAQEVVAVLVVPVHPAVVVLAVRDHLAVDRDPVAVQEAVAALAGHVPAVSVDPEVRVVLCPLRHHRTDHTGVLGTAGQDHPDEEAAVSDQSWHLS